jgi:mRNA degradation ribonuclease J1/J2
VQANGSDPYISIRKVLNEYLYSETQRQPMVLPVVIEGKR